MQGRVTLSSLALPSISVVEDSRGVMLNETESQGGVSEEDSGMHLRFEGQETWSSGCVLTCLSAIKHESSPLKMR